MKQGNGIRLVTAEEIGWVSGGDDGPYSPSVSNNSSNGADTAKVQAAISIIRDNYDSLSSRAQNAVDDIEHVVVDSASNGRSYVDYTTNTLHLNADEVANENPGYIAGSIAHDGDHILQQENDGGYNGVQSEKDATQLEIDNAAALHITDGDKAFLQKYVADANHQIEDRVAEPVNNGTGTHAPAPPPDPSDPDGNGDNTDPTDQGNPDGGDNSGGGDGDGGDYGGGGGGGDYGDGNGGGDYGDGGGDYGDGGGDYSGGGDYGGGGTGDGGGEFDQNLD